MAWFEDNAPTPSAPAPSLPTSPAGTDIWGLAERFKAWYGYAPSDEQLQDYIQQAQGRPNAYADVLQNLYRESPSYDPRRPSYGTWTPASTAPSAGGGTQTLTQAEFMRSIQGYPDTPAGLRQWVSDHPEYGVQIVGSSGGDLQLPDGTIVDVGVSFGAGGGQGWAWQVGGGGDGGGGGGMGSLTAPFREPFVSPTRPQLPPFVAPKPEDVLKSPEFQFRLAEGEKALQRSAAAKGTLLTGGTLKALTRYGQGLASEEYSNVYNRAFAEDQLRYGRAIGEYESAYDKALTEYRQRYDIFAANQDRPFAKLYQFANLGASMTGQLNQLGANYAGMYGDWVTGAGRSAADYWTQAANARAAGQVGSASAWGSAMGSLGPAAASLWWARKYGSPDYLGDLYQ